MNSSPVLRPQSQNKIRCEFQRKKNEHNLKQAESKLSKGISSLHLSNKDGENKDPAESGRKPPLQPAGSRLPVFAKSLKLKIPPEFKESHNKWEEKPLAVKAKKKPCTRPLPFNFSQPKSTRRAAENREPLTAPQSRSQSEHSSCKTPKKHQDVLKNSRDPDRGLGKSHGKAAVNAAHLSGKPSSKLKPSAPLSNPSSTSGNTVRMLAVPCKNADVSSARAHLHPEVRSDLLGGKEPFKTSRGDETASPTNQSRRLKPLNEKSEDFQPDHAALLSILRNEGVSHSSQPLVTPKHPKQYNYVPQRVSIMTSQQKDGRTPGPTRLVQFSPDAAALRSIVENEGVKSAGPVFLGGATPRNAACPPGRGSSIYTAQRVPVKKGCTESASRTVGMVKDTTQTKWTPQRVPYTKHQSAMKWHQSPYGPLGHRSHKSSIQPHQEREVVQRLFDDPEDEQSTARTDKNPSIETDQTRFPASSNKPPSEEKAESDSEEEDELKTFFLAPPRESVIFFSTGKKLIRAPLFNHQEGSAEQDHQGSGLSEQRTFTAAHSHLSKAAPQTNSAVQHQHKGFITQKPCSVSVAVAKLRKRYPPLEELRLDEEVAVYTSAAGPSSSVSVPPQPRCENPLASVLHFEESTRFVPVDFDLSSGPPLFSSSQHER